jgi:capsular polysaccharide biosynthesis protein
MDRTDKGHMNEKLNLRSFYLRLLKKLWLIPLAGIICGLVALGIYTLVTVTFGPAKSYQSTSNLYIKFAYDENGKTQVDSYNAYTWDHQVMEFDVVFDKIIENLEAQGYSGLDKKQVLEDITAEIPSDVRVLQVTVKDNDRELADAITTAVIGALENFGTVDEAFVSIKLMNSNKAELVTYTDRSLVAAAFGAVVGIVAMLFILLLLDAIDDAVYVPEDAEERYNLPVLGVLFKDSDKAEDSDEIFKNDLIATTRTITAGANDYIFLSADSLQDDSRSKEDLEAFKKALGSKLPENVENIQPISAPGRVLDNYRKISSCGGVILSVPYGVRCGSLVDHTISQLKKHGCRVVGVLLTRCDRRFLKRYYRISK